MAYSKQGLKYLEKVQCLDLHEQNHINVKYDLKQDRVVFLVNDLKGGRIVNAVGRTMKADGKPIYEVKDMKVGLFTTNE